MESHEQSESFGILSCEKKIFRSNFGFKTGSEVNNGRKSSK